MFLIIGLGNPGKEYAHNRHNVGFRVVDALAQSFKAAPWRKKYQGEITEVIVAGEKVLLLKPMTYMNLSGQSVQHAASFYKIPLENIIVFHDELDLIAGRIRVKTGGGDAGHNGLKSITSHCGAGYVRVRIGIGHPGDKERVHGHVLGDFTAQDQPWLEALDRAVSLHFHWLIEGKNDRFVSDVALVMGSE
jgi:peptidyl-tRNA hydrolase, PTH1 family